MKLTKKQTGKLIFRIAVCLCLAALVVALSIGNVVCHQYKDTITEFFYGESVITDSEELRGALEAGDKLNVEIEEEGIVLFRNEDMNRSDDTVTDVVPALPMTKTELAKINVFGWSATDRGWIAGSDGSCNANGGGNLTKYDSILDAFDNSEELLKSGVKMEYNKELITMYENFRNKRAERRGLNGHDQFFMLIEPDRSYYDRAGAGGKTLLENAKEFSDVALVVISRLGGENNDLPYFQLKNTTGTYSDSDTLPRDDSRTYLDLSTEEEALMDMVRNNFRKVIVVYNGCNNMNLNFLEDYDIDACISVNGPGQSGVDAIPRVLAGEVNPSGKSVQIQPYDLKTDPTFYNAGKYNVNGHTATYAENIYVGYRWYETADAEGYWADVDNKYGKGYDGVVQYPFGYGLSYTKFDWEVVNIDPAPGSSLTKDSVISIDVRVTNKGSVPGKDIVECYYTPPYYAGGIEKAAVNLAAFKKTALLEPGQHEVVTLSFDMYTMASYDCYDANYNRNFGYELDFGEYEIKLMTDSHHRHSCNNSLIKYQVDGNIKLKTDPTTGTNVVNRFTNYSVIGKDGNGQFVKHDVKAYANCALDGSDAVQADVVYLSRADFAGTFPVDNCGGRGGSAVSAAESYIPDMPSASTPKYGVESNLRLVTKQDGSSYSYTDLSKGLSNAKVNEDLVFELGKDYDSETWDKLLDQMSSGEIADLVQNGNYYNIAVESIGKPKLLDSDGPSGLNRHVTDVGNSSKTKWTMYSMPAVIAQSWNPSLSYAFGLSIANESISSGNNGWYAPGANIMRSPFCGRNSEYYSEDPLLSGIMAAESCRGAINNGMNVYLKHFAANETESGRIGLYTWMTEQTFREIYLKSFELAVKKGNCNGIMTSLNRIGAVWSGGSRALCTEILRNEWGFRGSVVTDSYIPGTNNTTQGLYGGVTLYLGVVSATNKFDMSNPVTATAARKAAKDIVYAWCNSYYTSSTHDSSEDYVVSNVGNFVQGEMPTAWWMLGLGAIDLVVAVGVVLAVLGLFVPKVFKRKKKVRAAAGGVYVTDEQINAYEDEIRSLRDRVAQLTATIEQLQRERDSAPISHDEPPAPTEGPAAAPDEPVETPEAPVTEPENEAPAEQEAPAAEPAPQKPKKTTRRKKV